MVFSDPLFLFGFLPLILTLHTCVPKSYRNVVLLAGSLGFYCWGEAQYVLVMLASIAANYLIGIKIGDCEHNVPRRKLWLQVAVITNLAMLVLFKYTNFILENLGGVTGLPTDSWPPIHLPIGISFFTFQAMSYVIDVYRGHVPAQRNVLSLALYIASFPQLIAGPIVRYRDVARQITRRVICYEKFSYGIQRFIIGLGKKVIIANAAAELADKAFALPATQLSTCDAWLGTFAYALQIYFDFSGYSDMAIGLGFMCGFRFIENFNYPYVSRSITEFWRRWHISLSTWFRDYLYVPLGGNRLGPSRTYLNLMIVFILCGLWHGASWTFLCWGMFHGSFLILERRGLSRLLQFDKPTSHAYTLLVVMLGWVLFRSETLAQASSFYVALAGQSQLFSLSTSLRLATQNYHIAILLIGVLAATPLGVQLVNRLERLNRVPSKWQPSRRWAFYISLTSLLWLNFVWSASLIVSGTYNPFIYFRF